MATETTETPAPGPAETRKEKQETDNQDQGTANSRKPEWRRRAEELLKLPTDQMWYATMGAASLAALGLLLPWLWIDDHATPHTMADMLTFYPSHPDKWFLMRTTPLGTLAVLVAPMFTTLFVIANAIKAIVNEPSTSLAIAGTVSGLVLVLLTGEITDPDRARWAAITLPQAGMWVTTLGNLSCIGLNAWTWRRNQHARDGETDGRSGFEW